MNFCLYVSNKPLSPTLASFLVWNMLIFKSPTYHYRGVISRGVALCGEMGTSLPTETLSPWATTVYGQLPIGQLVTLAESDSFPGHNCSQPVAQQSEQQSCFIKLFPISRLSPVTLMRATAHWSFRWPGRVRTASCTVWALVQVLWGRRCRSASVWSLWMPFCCSETVVTGSSGRCERTSRPLHCLHVEWYLDEAILRECSQGEKKEKTERYPCECRYPLINIYWDLARDQRQQTACGPLKILQVWLAGW